MERLHVEFAMPDGRVRTVFDGFDLEIVSGSVTCILGPTGCGKTTLLRAVAGLIEGYSGRIEGCGGPGRGGTGFVFQQGALFPWMDVAGNAGYGLRAAGVPGPERRRKVAGLLETVGLGGLESARTHQLSGGMQQRLALVRSIAPGPELLLLDEPFSALDARTRFDLEDVLLSIWERTGTTLLLVTHSIEEAVYLGDRVVVLGGEPARIALDRPLDLGRPRDRLSSGFVEEMLIVRRVFDMLVEGRSRPPSEAAGT
jgi:ABC-type nitrate/sulfonate/bicarbonate transport system ATPase subunit